MRNLSDTQGSYRSKPEGVISACEKLQSEVASAAKTMDSKGKSVSADFARISKDIEAMTSALDGALVNASDKEITALGKVIEAAKVSRL